MSRAIVAFTALLLVGASEAVGEDEWKDSHSVESYTIDLKSAGTEILSEECEDCHFCVGYSVPMMYTDTWGVSTIQSRYLLFECEPPSSCDGCPPEEDEVPVPEDVEDVLALRFEEGGPLSRDELFLLTMHLDVRVSDGVAAIRRQCGTLIGWLPVA